jgi:hypothetical protein
VAAPALKLIDGASGEVVAGDDSSLMARIEELERELQDAERDLRAKRRLITKLQKDKERERQNFEQREVVFKLFEFWQQRCQKPRSQCTADRFDALRKALESGYTPRQVALAIAGAAYDPFVTKAKNGREIKHNDLELICRDGKHLESFANKAPRRRDVALAT